MWRDTQNLLNYFGAEGSISFARNRLVNDRRADVVLHRHVSGGDGWVVSDAIKNRSPQVLSAELKDGIHFFARWRSKRFHCIPGRSSRKGSLVDENVVRGTDIVVAAEGHHVFGIGA